MKTTKEMIEIMQAYENGEKIEYRLKEGNKRWFKALHPEWDWVLFDYRIKPKVKECKFKEGDIIVYINKNSISYGSIFKVISCKNDEIHCDFVKLINFNIEKGTGSCAFKGKELEHFENALDDRFLWEWYYVYRENNGEYDIGTFGFKCNFSWLKKNSSCTRFKPIYELGFIDTKDENPIKDFIEVVKNEDNNYDDNLPFN